MANKPNIRFKGFTDDWEQRKLGEVFKEYSEKNHTELPALTIIQGGGTVLRDKSDRALQYDKSNLSTYKMVKKDDFIVHLRSFEGGLEKANSSGIISPAYHTFHGENTDCRFFYPFFRSRQFIDVLLKPHVYGIRDGKSIDIEGMKSILLPLPTYDEQRRIGNYIENLDRLITLHQRKCDETKKLKKFMLQKMFPKNGEKNPEIRFAGFTDDWEQRKLGEVCERINRKNKENESDLPLTISSQHGLIDQRDFFNKVVAAKDMSEYYLLQKGEFAYNKSYSNGYDYGSIKRLNSYEKGCLSTLYICFKLISDKVNSDYLECYFDTLDWYHNVSQICAEGARNHGLLNVDVKAFFTEVTVKFPVDVKEQQQISVILHYLDHLITLHQRKCDKLKLIKKFMLQNMFPKKG